MVRWCPMVLACVACANGNTSENRAVVPNGVGMHCRRGVHPCGWAPPSAFVRYESMSCVCLDSLDTLRGSVFVNYSIPTSLLIARPTTAPPYLRAPLGSGWDGSCSRRINRGLSGGDWCLRMRGGNWNYGLHREGVDDAMELVHMCVT